MFDTHYDLLSIAYVASLTNDYSYLEKVSKYFHKNNVTGVIANLYFMSEEEMKNELHPNYYNENVSVLEMFIKSKKILDVFLPDTDIIYSIEGADYIKDIDELRKLKDEGLDSLIITWNNKNKYGSGNRSEDGLTEEGKELLKEAIKLHIGIDFSHANKKTFYDMIELVKTEQEKGNDVCCYASHSNSFLLCDRNRNLDDEQLMSLASIGGLVGIFSNRNFIVQEKYKDIATEEEKRNYYIEHIFHISSIIGIDKTMVATDDMDFCKDADPEYKDLQIYDYSVVASKIKQDLLKHFNEQETNQIIHDNAYNKIYSKLKNNRKSKGGK